MSRIITKCKINDIKNNDDWVVDMDDIHLRMSRKLGQILRKIDNLRKEINPRLVIITKGERI